MDGRSWRPLLAAALVAVALVAGRWAPAAEDFGPGNARAMLVIDSGDTVEGGGFHLGVRFEIKPGWHIYWRNPGEAGLATGVHWRLPQGLEAGELRWPLPVAFDQSEGIPGYGYEGTVVLASEVRAVAGVDPGRAIVGAEVSWLACRDVCVLGSARLESTLSEIGRRFDLATWRASLPRAMNGGEPPFTVTTTGGLEAGAVSLWLRWRDPPAVVEWFPDPPDGIEVSDVRTRTRGGLTRIDAAVRKLGGTGTSRGSLDSLVVATSGTGSRGGWELTVDLTRNAR